MAIDRNFSFRVGPSVDAAGVEKLLTALPVGDGISFHNVAGIWEDGHLIEVTMHIGDPVTEDRIALARERVRSAFEKGFITEPQRTGLDGDDSEQLFQAQLDTIVGPPAADQLGGFLDRLSTFAQGAGLTVAALAVLFLVIAWRR